MEALFFKIKNFRPEKSQQLKLKIHYTGSRTEWKWQKEEAVKKH